MNMARGRTAGIILGLILVMVTGCISFAETPGERFRKAIKEIEAACAKRKLDPNEVCGGVAKLRPADPLATEEGRFAHSIKIPNAVPADSGYKPGMTPEQYFERLCRTEAGEFIFKTVDNVDGIYQMRPRDQVGDDYLRHLYAMEDLYGYSLGESSEPEGRYIGPDRYSFFETPQVSRQEPEWKKQYRHASYFSKPDTTAKVVRYFGYNGRDIKTIQKEYDTTRKSRYGYTWRGITRPNDRELGIVGGELIVLDLETNEVLAVRRGYLRGDTEPPRLGMVWKRPCPLSDTDGLFISKVLKPVTKKPEYQGGANGPN
jgi:hypothetical protein